MRPSQRRRAYRELVRPARAARNAAVAKARAERDEQVALWRHKCSEAIKLADLRYDTERLRAKDTIAAALEASGVPGGA